MTAPLPSKHDIPTFAARCPQVRRRWPSSGYVAGIVVTLLIVWRVATARSTVSLPPTGVPIRVVRAIDGDTLLLEGNFRIRLLGVNTPETKHPDHPPEPFGEEAYQFTRSLVDQQLVTLEFDRERLDTYRRVLAYVYLADGSLLNEQLIQKGMSPAIVSFPIRSDRKRLFEEAERTAQRNRAGIWTLPLWQVRLQDQRDRKARSR